MRIGDDGVDEIEEPGGQLVILGLDVDAAPQEADERRDQGSQSWVAGDVIEQKLYERNNQA